MQSLRVQLTPRTTLGSPLQADTLWGHLVVYYGYRYGQSELKDLLGEFENNPPFLLSDGFPRGYLPRPRLSLGSEKIDALVELADREFDDVNPKLVVTSVLDHFRKSEFINRELLQEHVNDLDMETIMRFLLTDALKPLDELDPKKLDESIREYVIVDKLGYDPEVWRPDIKLKSTQTIKNRVNRIRGSSEQMWGEEEYYWPGGFDLYFKILDDEYTEILRELLEDLEFSGYGKNKSTGKGDLRIENIEPVELPEADDPNAFISLSSFVPSEDDPTEGNYGIRVKRGKIGEWFPRDISPFKRPALMLKTGSTFKTEQSNEYYGSLLDNIHFEPEIRHYAYSLPLHVNLTTEN